MWKCSQNRWKIALFTNPAITPPVYVEIIFYAAIMLFGYFEIDMDAKIKFPNKFYMTNFTRKMATLAKSGHFTSKIIPVKFIKKFDFGIHNYLKISK